MGDILPFPSEMINDGLEPSLEEYYQSLSDLDREELEKAAEKLGVRPKALFTMCVKFFMAEVDANDGRFPLTVLPHPRI